MRGPLRGRLAVVALAVPVLTGCAAHGQPVRPAAIAPASAPGVGLAAVGPPARSASAIRRPASGYSAAIAVVGRLPVFRTPGGSLRLTLSRPRLTGGPLVMLIAQRGPTPAWLRVYLPVRPNGTTGWIRSADVRVVELPYRLDLQRRAHRLRLLRFGVPVRSYPVGLGRSGAPTPVGTFYLTERIRLADPTGPYGPYAFGLSAFSPTLFSFAGGNGVIGLHGTNSPGSVGGSVSHGCIRMRNADITALAKLLPLGTPVRVLA